jgi:hypothetical protein
VGDHTDLTHYYKIIPNQTRSMPREIGPAEDGKVNTVMANSSPGAQNEINDDKD